MIPYSRGDQMMRYDGSSTRRQFLKGSVAAATAGSLPVMAASGEKSRNQKPASQPTTSRPRTARPDWWIACRDAQLREVGEPDSWAAMAAIAVDGVEVHVNGEFACDLLFAPDQKFEIGSPPQIKALADRFKSHKKTITALCIDNRFDERQEEDVAFTLKVAAAAVELGVPAIRLDVVPRRLRGKEDEFLDLAIKLGKQIVKETSHTKLRFGVENHGDTTNKVEFMRRLLDGIGSDRFGITLDTANLYWYGYPLARLYEIYTEYAPRVCHTHCKNIHYPASQRDKERPIGWEYGTYCCPIYEGDIDFRKVAAILLKAGYHGDLCIEDESLGRFPKPQRREILAKEVIHLRQYALA